MSSRGDHYVGVGDDGRRERRLKAHAINMPKPEDDSRPNGGAFAISYTTWQTPSGDVDDNLLTREAMTPRQKFLRESTKEECPAVPRALSTTCKSAEHVRFDGRRRG